MSPSVRLPLKFLPVDSYPCCVVVAAWMVVAGSAVLWGVRARGVRVVGGYCLSRWKYGVGALLGVWGSTVVVCPCWMPLFALVAALLWLLGWGVCVV